MDSRFERLADGRCPACGKAFAQAALSPEPCTGCGRALLTERTDGHSEGKLDQCAGCGCPDLYRAKDFDRKIGLGLVTAGVIASFWTYGLSLLAVTLLDLWLYRRVGEAAFCYRCGTRYRKWEGIAEVPPFNLVMHDHYRNRATSDTN